MEVDGIAESLLVPEASCSRLHGLYPAIDALGKAVVGFQNYGVNDSPKVAFQRGRDFLHGRQAAANHPVDQPLPALRRPRAMLVVP